MTTVKFYPELYKMEITGHSGFAPTGQDVVCAGASTLAHTLISAASDVEEYRSAFYMNNERATIIVECEPDMEYRGLCMEMFRTIMTGFEILQGEYPDYVKVVS